jgi:hypothetical protein
MSKFFAIISVLFLVGCKTTEPLSSKNSNLTQGNVQNELTSWRNYQSGSFRNFGSPNVTTRDASGQEVWSYQRAAQVAQSTTSEGYWTIIFAGQSKTATGFESSSRMITLIIKFDENDVVTDFRSRESNF